MIGMRTLRGNHIEAGDWLHRQSLTRKTLRADEILTVLETGLIFSLLKTLPLHEG